MKEKNSGFFCLLKDRRPYYEKSKEEGVHAHRREDSLVKMSAQPQQCLASV